jgi:hypothetical protein
LEIADWLRGLSLERYAETFRDNAVDVAVLPELSKADLEKLGVLLGHRKIMLRAIAAASWRRGRTHCGACVGIGSDPTLADESDAEGTVSIVGADELDPARGGVSWISPIATALLKAQVGDVVTMRTPRGTEELEIIAIRYDELP